MSLHLAADTDQLAAPPHNLDAEEAILGCALLAGTKIVQVANVDEGLRPEAFYRDRNAETWRAMLDLVDQAQAVDHVTVAERLRTRGATETARDVDRYMIAPPAVSGARSYARLVVETWRLRVARTALLKGLEALDRRDEPAMQAALAGVNTAGRGTLDPRPDAVARRFAQHLTEPKLPPLPLPWPTLAKRFRMRPGATTVLASWTSWAKSWVALELASHVGTNGHDAIVWTNEMDEPELVARHVQRTTGITTDDALDAERGADPAKLAGAVRRLQFGVRECFGWAADDVARDMRHHKPALAVLDHFHQLPGIGKHDQAEHAVQTLTSAARQAGTHLLIVAQLNTARDTQDKRPDPTMRDLRSTGALQSLPNNVVFLRRKQEHDRDRDQSWLSDQGMLHVAKQRGGRSPLYQAVLLPPDRMTVREAPGWLR